MPVWLAAIVANSVFLSGCMIGHIRSMIEAGNLAAYNIGPNIIPPTHKILDLCSITIDIQ